MDQSQSQLVPLDELVDGLASIKRLPFKVLVGIFYGLAIISVLARAGIRWSTRRALFLDDYLLFAAALFLSGATGLMYNICDNLYLSTAIRLDTTIVFRLDSQRLNDLVNNAVQENHSFLIIAWTATFLVKFSFLGFFKQLIWKVSKIQRYYWAVVAITVVSWMFLISEPFILCSDFGFDSLKCFDESKNLLYVSMTGLITGLDALTDLMIVSIPIIVLHRARMRTQQKLALGAFLCLSLVMVVFSITRVSKIKGASGIDVPWSFFWQFMEASIAVLMGSLTVFRTLLISESNKRAAAAKNSPSNNNSPPVGMGVGVGEKKKPYYLSSLLGMIRRKKGFGDLESQEGEDGLPEIPRATLTGLRTFIRRNNRDSHLKTMTGAELTAISQNSTLAGEEEALHAVKEKEDKLNLKEEVRQMTPVQQQQQQQQQQRPRMAYHYPVSCRSGSSVLPRHWG
ncbi:hypothetical protein C8A03DRAFT_18982 [Achaetomium macrosporum]|uniref:Rhodopsin domain-containing protein n=1 Tax=Achaetomium macrosporum TaxID=79813 RepID=A0AAN7C2B0_9PEZI|nr:hypothetical protein C8A03DRAFT_18982 [Achaetomium macrosporum]